MRTLTLVVLVILIGIGCSGCASLSDAEAAKGSGSSKVYDGKYEAVWTALLESARSTGLELVAEDKGRGTILAQGKAGGLTWGENVAIFVEDAKGATRVEIVNKRAIATNVTARDWDRTLFAELDKRFQTRDGQSRPSDDARPAEGTALATPAAAAFIPRVQGMPVRGTRWRYTYRDEQYEGARRIFTVEIADVQGSNVKERLSVEGGNISEALVESDQLRFMARTISDAASVVELAPYAPALYSRSGTVASGYPSPTGAMWNIGKLTYGQERVTVPAGSFDAIRVEVKGSSPFVNNATMGVPSRFIYTCWYSPQLHRYVRSRHETWNMRGQRIGDEVVQLMSYQSGK